MAYRSKGIAYEKESFAHVRFIDRGAHFVLRLQT